MRSALPVSDPILAAHCRLLVQEAGRLVTHSTASQPAMAWERRRRCSIWQCPPVLPDEGGGRIEETGLASNSTSRARGPLGGLEKNVLRIALVNAPH